MDYKEVEKCCKSFSEERKSTSLPEGSKPYLNYILFHFLILFSIFNLTAAKPNEIRWLPFEKDLLKVHDVDRIVADNKVFAENYYREHQHKSPKYLIISNGAHISKLGPHFINQLGLVAGFESKLQQAQQNILPEESGEIAYDTGTNLSAVNSWIIPFGILILFWVIMLRGWERSSMVDGTNFIFEKSIAKLIDKDTKNKATFKDVGGLWEAKREVEEIVDFLKNSKTYTKLGAKIPKGFILVGATGTGKTLMAKAIAGEAQVPFFSLTESKYNEIIDGVGASRVRDLFKQAKEKAPSLIFIDDIEALGHSRSKVNAIQDIEERENTLNQLLSELDDFGTNTGVIVLAATNRADILDKALLLPGRFDRHIYLELPTKQERMEIFEVHLRSIKKGKDVDVKLLACQSPGLSGADIANICNEAALIAARKKKKAVTQEDFREALERIVWGLESTGKIISPKEKEIFAYHEAGHAVASWFFKNADAMDKVSIIPRGKFLGSARNLPDEYPIITKAKLLDQICASLGGRAAEEIIFNEVSSGALDDLVKVTLQAYTMVAHYGLNDKIGPISFYDSSGENERLSGKPYSENMATIIDKEVQALIVSAYNLTIELLLKHQNKLESLGQLLLKKEVVYLDDLEKILGKRTKELAAKVRA